MSSLKTRTTRKPVLGWVSVANAVLLSAFIVTIPSIVVAQSAIRTQGGGSIGALAGRTGSVAFLVLGIEFAFGLLVALAGVIRKERPIWVHGLGVSLNLGAPGIGLVILRVLYY